jgi:hypothetical protein
MQTLSPSTSQNSIHHFIKMPVLERAHLLRTAGTLLDSDSNKGEKNNLYYLHGFFVEETLTEKSEQIVDIIPFRQGYRIETCLKMNTHFSGTTSFPASRLFLN